MSNPHLPDCPIQKLPQPPRFRSIIGPSVILLGLGLGSGEVILWPYLSANFGLGIIWAAVLGLTIQFFLNMEVERYALVRGESVFVGFARLWRGLSYWFIISTFMGFGWPGIIAASAKILSPVVNVNQFSYLAIGLLITIGIILTIGPVLYKTVETYQKLAISVGIPIIMYLVFKTASAADWQALGSGLFGHGDFYRWLPAGIPLFTFLGALAYAGAGGNLNLAQSLYVKEKGYGMGRYSGHITSVLTGTEEKMPLVGTTFAANAHNLRTYRQWWRLVNLEHGLVFWGLGTLTICLLSLLAYATVYGISGNATGIDFIINEARVIGGSLRIIFLLVAGLMLFGTQLTVLDSTSRIITENIAVAGYGRVSIFNHPRRIYYTVLWLQIIFGITVLAFGFSEPQMLVVVGSVINAVAMFVSFPLVLWLNTTLLPVTTRPSLVRRAITIGSFIFFGYFVFIAAVNAFS